MSALCKEDSIKSVTNAKVNITHEIYWLINRNIAIEVLLVLMGLVLNTEATSTAQNGDVQGFFPTLARLDSFMFIVLFSRKLSSLEQTRRWYNEYTDFHNGHCKTFVHFMV